MRLLPVLFGLLVAALPATAREEIPAETRIIPWSAQISSCDSPGVLSKLQHRFNATERRFWNSNAEIIGFEKVRQAAFRPHGLDLIPRRYCQAQAVMADRRRLTMRYAIIEETGIIGMTEGVQFCLSGYDRNHTAMPGCYRLDR
ncbi:MAG: hypothetical protein O9342_17570 [Beijerinckiaceae bacterium]|nr:hypothetical protein [Beijerinckiaceae bacterium]